MPLPLPPYTYNDPRLAYNEHCFFYNGGYDEQSLLPPAPEPIVVIRGGKSTRYRTPHHKLDVLLTTFLSGVNSSSFDRESSQNHVRFLDHYEDDPKVKLFEIKVGASLKKVEAYPKELITDKATRNVEVLEASKISVNEPHRGPEFIVKADLIKVKRANTEISGSLKGK